jgi:hypothetical protein
MKIPTPHNHAWSFSHVTCTAQATSQNAGLAIGTSEGKRGVRKSHTPMWIGLVHGPCLSHTRDTPGSCCTPEAAGRGTLRPSSNPARTLQVRMPIGEVHVMRSATELTRCSFRVSEYAPTMNMDYGNK